MTELLLTGQGNSAAACCRPGGAGSSWSLPAAAYQDRSSDRFYQPHLSPDGRWFTFIIAGQSRYGVYVTPFRDRGLIGEREWIAVAEGATGFDKPRWSPDGSLLYYTSDRDGFRCIYAQRLDAATRRPAGVPLPIYHSHNARLSIRNMEIGLLEMFVGRDRLVFGMGERKGNIWMIAPRP